MALFSRTKSKVRETTEQEVPKAAEEEKTATPDDASQRGRKGKEAVRPYQNDYASAVPPSPGPSQPLRPLHHTSYGYGSAYNRSDSFGAKDYLAGLNKKQDYPDSHSSSDSGYSSAGPQSRSLSRTPTIQREMGCFQISNKSMTQLYLGEGIAREPGSSSRPSLQGDTIDRSSAQHSKAAEGRFLNPARSLQGMRTYFRPEHAVDTPLALPPQNRYQDARYQRQIQQSMPMRPTSVPPQGSRSRSERVSRPPPQCSSSSSGPVLQSSRSVYALRPIAAVPSSSRLPDWSNQIPSNLDQQLQATPLQSRSPTSPTPRKTHAHAKFPHKESKPPLSILHGLKVNKQGLILDEEGGPIGELWEGDIIDCVREKADAYGAVLDECGRVVGRVRTLLKTDTESMLRSKASDVEKLHGFPLPPVSMTSSAAKSSRFDDARSNVPGQTKGVSTQKRGPSRAKTDVILQEHDHEQTLGQKQTAPSRPRLHGRSESLPSVPESHSTAEKEPSDEGSSSDEESQQGLVDEGIPSQKRVRATSSARTEPHRRYPMSSHGRSVSEPIHLTTALPPVPPKGKRPLDPMRAKAPVVDITTTSAHDQRTRLTTIQSRVQSLSLPTFQAKGPAVGLPRSSLCAGAPVFSITPHRLTTPALSTPSSPGIASLSVQPPILRPRASGTIPLVRSPLSSQENSLSDSEHIIPVEDLKSTSPQSKYLSRSQSMKISSATASAMNIGKQLKRFTHANTAAAKREADFVVEEIGNGVQPEKKEKKKGILVFFGRKN